MPKKSVKKVPPKKAVKKTASKKAAFKSAREAHAEAVAAVLNALS